MVDLECRSWLSMTFVRVLMMRVMVLDSVGLHECQTFELSILFTGDEFSILNHFVRGDSMIRHHILIATNFS